MINIVRSDGWVILITLFFLFFLFDFRSLRSSLKLPKLLYLN